MIKQGCSRTVLLIGKYALKIATWKYQHKHFLKGCYDNVYERETTLVGQKYRKCGGLNLDYWNKTAPTVWCSLFGILSIQKRCNPLPWDKELTDTQEEYFKHFSDVKPDNIGYLNGKLVCFDYAT